jgi:hypothetical protein
MLAAGPGSATLLLDLIDDFLGGRGRRALPVDRAAEIVDHDLGAFAPRRERDLAADAAPGPGDDDDLSLEGFTHRTRLPVLLKLGTRPH